MEGGRTSKERKKEGGKKGGEASVAVRMVSSGYSAVGESLPPPTEDIHEEAAVTLHLGRRRGQPGCLRGDAQDRGR